MMITFEEIIAQLDRISADSWYDVSGDYIHLTIDDFEGFDDDWCEVLHLDEPLMVEEVLDWLEEHADCLDEDYHLAYRFGDILVDIDYTSDDI